MAAPARSRRAHREEGSSQLVLGNRSARVAIVPRTARSILRQPRLQPACCIDSPVRTVLPGHRPAMANSGSLRTLESVVWACTTSAWSSARRRLSTQRVVVPISLIARRERFVVVVADARMRPLEDRLRAYGGTFPSSLAGEVLQTVAPPIVMSFAVAHTTRTAHIEPRSPTCCHQRLGAVVAATIGPPIPVSHSSQVGGEDAPVSRLRKQRVGRAKITSSRRQGSTGEHQHEHPASPHPRSRRAVALRIEEVEVELGFFWFQPLLACWSVEISRRCSALPARHISHAVEDDVRSVTSRVRHRHGACGRTGDARRRVAS